MSMRPMERSIELCSTPSTPAGTGGATVRVAVRRMLTPPTARARWESRRSQGAMARRTSVFSGRRPGVGVPTRICRSGGAGRSWAGLSRRCCAARVASLELHGSVSPSEPRVREVDVDDGVVDARFDGCCTRDELGMNEQRAVAADRSPDPHHRRGVAGIFAESKAVRRSCVLTHHQVHQQPYRGCRYSGSQDDDNDYDPSAESLVRKVAFGRHRPTGRPLESSGPVPAPTGPPSPPHVNARAADLRT